jgi:23S rRNA pseudouridine2604 synthase
MEPERLSKIMAQRGLCSRREADDFIVRGWVFVDGKPITELGTKISPNQEIVLAPEALGKRNALVTVLLNKPVGYVSGQPERGYEPAVVLVKPANRWKADQTRIEFQIEHLQGLAPAGRLDIDSHGLLVMTQDGRIARKLIGQDSSIDKEYIVKVTGDITPEKIALLRHGLVLDDRQLRPAKIDLIGLGKLRFTLREGRKRQIRRMCDLVNLKVRELERVRIGKIYLGVLPVGQWRYLAPEEQF